MEAPTTHGHGIDLARDSKFAADGCEQVGWLGSPLQVCRQSRSAFNVAARSSVLQMRCHTAPASVGVRVAHFV